MFADVLKPHIASTLRFLTSSAIRVYLFTPSALDLCQDGPVLFTPLTTVRTYRCLKTAFSCKYVDNQKLRIGLFKTANLSKGTEFSAFVQFYGIYRSTIFKLKKLSPNDTFKIKYYLFVRTNQHFTKIMY